MSNNEQTDPSTNQPEQPKNPANDITRRCENDNCGVCPFLLLPKSSLAKLIRLPFHKRHPFIFWSGLIFFCLVFLSSFFGILDADEESGIERIALVEVKGPIMDASPVLEWLAKVSDNPLVKGVLVRVDSPGGGAASSQEIYASLAALAQRIPVAVSMGATAASGGLMVSMAGKRIFANPSTVTGSIGVRMDIPQLQGLMDKLGIGQETLVTAPFKDATSYMKPMTPQDRAYLENVIMNMHDQFVHIVAKGRNMAEDKVRELANGKIYTGQQAQELGLIDVLGGQQEAHAWLARETGIPQSRKLLKKPVSKTKMLEKLLAYSKILGIDLTALENDSLPGIQPVFLY